MEKTSPLNANAERELIKLAQSGDLCARNELVVSILPILRNKLQWQYACMPSQDLADILQDTAIEIIFAIDRYDLDHPNRPRLSWFMHKPVLGVVRRFYRHSDRSVSVAAVNVSDDSDPCDDLDRQQVTQLVTAALSKLPPQRSGLLVARYADGQNTSQRQVGESWGCSRQNVQRQELKARAEFVVAWGEVAA